MASTDTKIGIGDEAKLQDAVNNGILDGGDLAITTNDQFYYINKSKELKRIKPRVDTFNSVDEAIAAINADPFISSKEGQPLSIKTTSGFYDIYTIVKSGDGTYTVKTKEVNTSPSGLTWVEF